ncbi:hypothetical protein PHMEG_00023776 [Phytophthora megakarya]|uniref:Uncharacterized protein n=1 Tax=Phytophthora megakarya TaxID=4795 RepID=A0A225VG64_9STRA|nr:hypothetical protein PHMEG_00023776 [Phytophthora megakarya]
MDKFGMYFAFSEGKKGKLLARNAAMQYYRQAKIWILDQFPPPSSVTFVAKAPPCTKADLKRMLVHLYTNACSESDYQDLYTNACSESDYQDASLLCLLWFLFGRASDLSKIRKRNISIDRDAPAAVVAVALTSHSFYRGGAQHANGCEQMTARWIFDRGTWKLSTTNNGFNYIFNTSREDHMIAKVLSRYQCPDNETTTRILRRWRQPDISSAFLLATYLPVTTCHLAVRRHAAGWWLLDSRAVADNGASGLSLAF